MTSSKQPDFVYDPEDWEWTVPYDERSEFFEDDIGGEPKEFGTLIKGPSLWAKRVAVSLDEDGYPDETEIRWFSSYEKAKKA